MSRGIKVDCTDDFKARFAAACDAMQISQAKCLRIFMRMFCEDVESGELVRDEVLLSQIEHDDINRGMRQTQCRP